MIKNVIGVDPGLKGAIVLIGDFSPVVVPMPVTRHGAKTEFNVKEIYEAVGALFIQSFNRDPLELWIEKPGVFPFIEQTCAACGVVGPPRKSAASSRPQGYCHGLFEMACAAYDIEFHEIPAKAWQKIMLAGMHGENPKELSIARATQMYPEVSLKRTERCRVDDDGIADAPCIATYGQRVINE